MNGTKEKELDFIWRLNDFVNTLDLFAPSVVGILDEGESISVMAMPGGEETVYFDGTRDKNLNIQINAKSTSQFNCIEALSHIARVLENLPEDTIKSENDSFYFNSMRVASFVSIVGQDEQGFFIYQISLVANITIQKGVDMNG